MTSAFAKQPQLSFGKTDEPAAFDRSTPEFSKDNRKRLRERFARAGAAGLNDYELLEKDLCIILKSSN